jgi:hypothetical protein
MSSHLDGHDLGRLSVVSSDPKYVLLFTANMNKIKASPISRALVASARRRDERPAVETRRHPNGSTERQTKVWVCKFLG